MLVRSVATCTVAVTVLTTTRETIRYGILSERQVEVLQPYHHIVMDAGQEHSGTVLVTLRHDHLRIRWLSLNW